MKQQIAIIGSGITARTILEKMDKAILVSPEEAKQLPFPKSEPLIINNPYPIETVKDQFICKGKHQYREVRTTENNVTKVEWICQCGKKL
jgi:hypothetical protein